MYENHRNFFSGKLCEGKISLNNINTLDSTKESSIDRLDFINSKYKKVIPFYEEYINKFYKVSVTSKNSLSEDINVFKSLETDATYLINSKDIKKDKTIYKILNEKDFKKILQKEKFFSKQQCEDEVLEILESMSNDYINIKQKIYKQDFDDPDLKEVLVSYEILKAYLKNEMHNLKNKKESNFTLHRLKKLLKNINDDMLLAKIQLKGIRSPAKRLGDISAKPDYSLVHYSNPFHVRQILKNIKFCSLQPDSELSHIIFDIKNTIVILYHTNKIDYLDLKIIKYYNKSYSFKKIAIIVKRDTKTIQQRINKIIHKISNYYILKEKSEKVA